MIRIQVTNKDEQVRTWNVEPLGDEIALAPEDVLDIELPSDTELLVEVLLYPGGETIWPSSAADTLLPADLKVNGHSIWPAK